VKLGPVGKPRRLKIASKTTAPLIRIIGSYRDSHQFRPYKRGDGVDSALPMGLRFEDLVGMQMWVTSFPTSAEGVSANSQRINTLDARVTEN
jgi:hypothetical protein